MQKSSKVPKYKIQPKHQNMTVFADFLKISEIWCEGFLHFWHFDAFSPIYSGRSRKMQKNSEIRAKFGIDTADILIFWVEKRILILWWYFDTLAVFGPLQNQSENARCFTWKSAASHRIGLSYSLRFKQCLPLLERRFIMSRSRHCSRSESDDFHWLS